VKRLTRLYSTRGLLQQLVVSRTAKAATGKVARVLWVRYQSSVCDIRIITVFVHTCDRGECK